ncbi:hypothetical protein ARD30_09160 [Bosea thiooxidans]|jgi:2'-5' RNA ligase|uniref:2'-5' RNA ligase n=1 Tax=Bosea thiooxidans TaxID=53254 RepID=A0A0Q3T1Q3_9HYPH|nr:2'-5' RNA ligase family protein [Bosea thiooxidans]KQK31634.1 hypothetical protein ARD30_09160 [Bosea thiooxidans]SKB66170.1 2'-5' RNA ligase [Bosea thiooxidans]
MIGITLHTASEARPFWLLVDRAAGLEASSSIRALGYPPHVTLVRYTGTSPDLLRDAAGLLETEAPFSLTFDRVGIFDVDPIVLWLSPQRDRRLVDLHAKIHRVVDPALCDPHYRPEQWRPHLTLAMAIPRTERERALALVAQRFEPFSLVFDVAECVAWPPIRVLSTLRLGG